MTTRGYEKARGDGDVVYQKYRSCPESFIQQPVSDNNIPQPDDIVNPTTEKNSASEPRYSLHKGEPDKNPREAMGAEKKPVNPFIPNKKDKPKAYPNPLILKKKGGATG